MTIISGHQNIQITGQDVEHITLVSINGETLSPKKIYQMVKLSLEDYSFPDLIGSIMLVLGRFFFSSFSFLHACCFCHFLFVLLLNT